MKFLHFFWPRSLWFRFFLLGILLVVTTSFFWVMLWRMDDPRPRVLAQVYASIINVVRVSLLTADPELRPTLLSELSDQEGIRLLPKDPDNRIAPLPDDPLMQAIQKGLRQLLGQKTQVSLEVNEKQGLWISFELSPIEDDEFWLILPKERIEPRAWPWMSWGLSVATMALIMGYALSSQIQRSLRRIAEAARQVGMGHLPPPLPEKGPEELSQLYKAFNRMSHDLAYIEKERAEILAGISHDLRTPLTRLRLEAELSLPEGQAREGMVADITQMDAIIAQFLDYARSGEKEQMEMGDPGELLEAVRQYGEAIQHPVTLKKLQLPTVLMKTKSINRALVNLIDNAWKYGVPPVSLSGRVFEGWLEFSVMDCGEGIPPEEIERLKQPFTRRQTARSDASGTGLGLAIVERVARNHGGSLEFCGKPQYPGFTAVLRIPLSCPGKGSNVSPKK